MTRIKYTMMKIKYLRGLARLWVCYKLGGICMKLNDSCPEIVVRIGARGAEDIMYVLKAFDLTKEYEDIKRMYDETF